MKPAFALIACLAAAVAAADSKPRAPFLLMSPAALGVYEGAGCDGVARVQDYANCFGRKPDQVIDFVAWASWSFFEVRLAKHMRRCFAPRPVLGSAVA